MPLSEWKETTLGEFSPFIYGKGLPERDRVQNGNIPVYGSNGIVGKHDKAYVNNSGIIIGRKGTIGSVHLCRGPFCPIDTSFYIEDEPQKRDLFYTYYLLKTLPLKNNNDSAVPGLNRDYAHNLIITVPDIPEQQAIAEVLGSLDDKIELNRKMNKTLEDMAQAIFKSWFVDFDPVKAKAEGRTIEGLSQEILDLFPDSFEPSELGDIPKGWKIKKLEDLGDVICGKTPLTSKKEYYGQDIPFITIPDMHGKTFVTETNKTLSKLGADSQKNKYLPPFSISMSCIATPGLVILNPITAQTNQQINSIIPSDVNLSFYYFYLLKQISQTVISNGSGGSVFHNLNTSSFKEIKTTINNKMGLEFNKIIKPIMTQILENQNEIQTLSTIRDTLLPKLISGELRIPDAEKLVEGVV